MLVQAVLERPQLRYPLHFALLALFAAVLALRPVAAAINPFGRNWPEPYFGIYGAAHAIAVLLSTMRRRSAAAAIVFVASAALLCMAVALLSDTRSGALPHALVLVLVVMYCSALGRAWVVTGITKRT